MWLKVKKAIKTKRKHENIATLVSVWTWKCVWYKGNGGWCHFRCFGWESNKRFRVWFSWVLIIWKIFVHQPNSLRWSTKPVPSACQGAPPLVKSRSPKSLSQNGWNLLAGIGNCLCHLLWFSTTDNKFGKWRATISSRLDKKSPWKHQRSYISYPPSTAAASSSSSTVGKIISL